jgi:hypothetical protein
VKTSVSTIIAAWSVWGLVAACHECPDKPDECIETDLTLTQGVYGQLLQGTDVIHDESCEQYAQPVSYPVWLQTADGARVTEDVADARGAFELVAPAGEYFACIRDTNANDRCGGMVTVPATGRMRYDISTSVLSTFVIKRGPARCAQP